MADLKRRFRPMGIGDVLDEAFDLYKSNFVLLVGIGAVLYVPIYSFFAVFMGTSMGQFFTSLTPAPGAYPPSHPPAFNPNNLFSVIGGFVILMVVMGLIQSVLMIAFSRAISQRYLGESTTIGACYSFIGRRFVPVLGTVILYNLAIGLPFLPVGVLAGLVAAMGTASPSGGEIAAILGMFFAMMVGGVLTIMLYCRLLFAPAALVVEDNRYWAAIKRSWNLSAGFGVRIFGFMILTVIIVGLVNSVISNGITQLVMLATHLNMKLTMMVSFATQGIFQSLTAPIVIIVTILLYYDVRIRKEGFDLQMLARDLVAADAEALPSMPSGVLPQVETLCAHCKYPIRDGDDVTYCTKCGVVHHSGCWRERGGCSNPACRSDESVSTPQQ